MAHFVFVYPQIKKLTGAQRLILALAGAICETEADHRVTLLTHRFAPQCRPALPTQVELIETGFNLNRIGNHYFDSLLEYASVPFLIKHLPADAEAICFFGPPSLPGLWWAKHFSTEKSKRSLLYFCYEPPRAAYTDRREVSQRMGRVVGRVANLLFGLYRPLDKYLAQQADAILVNGEYGQNLIAETYGRSSTIITHGFELAQLPDLDIAAHRIRQRYRLGQRPLILTVNHLHPRKRIDLLLKAMPAILAECPDAAVLIVGQGPEEAALRALAAQLGLTNNPDGEDKVIFVGFAAENELPAYYHTAQVYAHPGRAESFGLAVLEANAAGLPVVSANEGGPCEILENEITGFLIEPEPNLFAQKISWLLQNPEQAQQMGENGAKKVRQRYTWQRGAQDFIKIAKLA